MELNPDAVRDAVQNAKMNDVKNIQFYRNDAGRFIVNMAEKGEKVDVILMDPQEAEVRREFIDAVAKMGPERGLWSPAGRKHLLEIFGGLWEWVPGCRGLAGGYVWGTGHGDGSLDVKEREIRARKRRISGLLRGEHHQRSLAKSSVSLYGNISTVRIY